MALAHQSIATINSPQFINLQPLDINPLMSSCQIKVLYVGENRNKTYISKQVAVQMAKTLRGAPIVGYYKENKGDYGDHGEQLILDDQGLHFNCLTKPYGFVAPNAQVWFQDFQEQDDFKNSITRTYLMTTGYLWSGHFKEAQQVFDDGGKPQSMQLENVQGKWSTNIKNGMQFFIINDAIFSKLCILGDDVEPCFEGSAVTAPQVSASFTLDKNFKQTLFEMMQELTYALKGGNNTVANTNNTSQKIQEEGLGTNTASTVFTAENEDNTNQTFSKENEVTVENPDSASSFKKDEESKEDAGQDDNDTNDNDDADKSNDDDDEKKNGKFTELKNTFDALQEKYSALESELKELRTFKENVENQKKDSLIKEFYMLSDEDKKDIIENKAKYSLDEIKSKLAVICFEKKVNFNLEETSENESYKRENDKSVMTYNMETGYDSTPDWVKEAESAMNEF